MSLPSALSSFLALAMLLAAVPPLSAAPAPAATAQARPVIPLVHTRWLVKDGAPPNVSSIVQTPDGWLWLASAAGLFRFDGVSFSRYQPAPGSPFNISGAIDRMGVLDDGTLWFSPKFGKLFLLRGDKLEMFDHVDGAPPGVDDAVVRSGGGRLWLISDGLSRLNPDGRTWRDMGPELGLPDGFAPHDLLIDRRGTMWIMGSAGVFKRAPDAPRFVHVADQLGDGRFQEAPDGGIWASDMTTRTIRRVAPGSGPQEARVFDRIGLPGFTIDRLGNIWFSEDAGLVRTELRRATARQHFSREHGLSGQHVNHVFEDREGNVWVATDTGLDQFRTSRVRELALPHFAGEARALAAGPGGQLWIDHYYLRHPDAAAQPFGPPSSYPTLVRVLYRDSRGVLWCAAHDGIWRIDALQRIRVPYPAPLASSRHLRVYALARDDAGGLWISLGPNGTWRLGDGVWTQHGGVAGLRRFPATTIVAGPDRTLWFGSLNNALAVLRDGRLRKIGPADGLDVDTILHIFPRRGGGVYIGGEAGLAFFDGRRARRIQGAGGEQFDGATGIVIAPGGDFWANTSRGLVWIRAAELTRWHADPAYQPRFRRFDENDGLKGGAVPLIPAPSMITAGNGELIVSTSSGVFRLDPASLASNRLPPPVQATAIWADARQYRPGPGVLLAAAPDTVRIDYTALSMALPQRVRFRYRLDGVDEQWQEAGARRSAFYTQLAPGTYTFRVIAANEDGLWNEQGARLSFRVPPTPTQTLGFKLLCAGALALAVWALHRLRLRVALRRQRRALEARVAERERIARDLHDTLLQSVQGLILSFRRIANRTPPDAPTRSLMDDALVLATDVLVEGRNKVGGLRQDAEADRRADLAAALQAHGQQMVTPDGPRFALRARGAVRPLHPAVYDEVLSIGREAIRNGFMHAGASEIAVELAYGERQFELRVRDNGRGIDEQFRAGRPGHWGIPGMHERAAQLGAVLVMDSAPGAGCIWRLHLASGQAYAASPHGAAAAAHAASRSDHFS